MCQSVNSSQRQSAGHLCWLLSLLLFLSPLLAQAQWEAPPEETIAATMPCHQSDSGQNTPCKHCANDSLNCICCEGMISPSLTAPQTQLMVSFNHFMFTPGQINRALPDSPPDSLYRPPIAHLI